MHEKTKSMKKKINCKKWLIGAMAIFSLGIILRRAARKAVKEVSDNIGKDLLVLCMTLFAATTNIVAKPVMEKEDITVESFTTNSDTGMLTVTVKNNTKDPLVDITLLLEYKTEEGAVEKTDTVKKFTYCEPGEEADLAVPLLYFGKEAMNKLASIDCTVISFNKDFSLVSDSDADDSSLLKGLSGGIMNENIVVKMAKDYFKELLKAYFIVMVIAFLAFVALYYILLYIVYVMARNRNRSSLTWVFLACFATPLVVILLLLTLGKPRYDETRGEFI